MTFLQFIFYVFSAMAVGSAIMVVASANPVRGALCLVLVFFAMAGIWMLLHAEFLSLVLVLVYVGAVMTLFLFVVMMLRVDVATFRHSFVRYLPLGVLMVLAMVGLIIVAVGPQHFGFQAASAPPLKPLDYSNTSELGMVLYTEYAYPFEIAAVMLLTAIVAAITLTHRKPSRRKNQETAEQINIQKNNRVKLLKMESEPKFKSTPGGKI